MVEKIRRIFLFLIICSIIVFLLWDIFSSYQGKQDFINRKYSGVILKIRNIEGNRDIPDIEIKDQWIILGLDDSKVKHYIQEGDSIVKDSGTEIIKVFRKNSMGAWDLKIFK